MEEIKKSYVCLFTCFTTRAIHLELVKDMTAQQFSLALQKFINRRGKTNLFYSDNASQLKLFQELHVSEFKWQYIKPLAP